MSVIAELTLSDPILFGPTFEAVPDAELTFEDVHYVHDHPDAVRYVFFAWARGCPSDAFESAAEADPSLAECERLVAFEDRRLYRIVTPALSPSTEPLVFPLFRTHDLVALESRRTGTGLHLRARAPSRDALRDLQSDLAERGASLQVTKLTREDDAGTSALGLTEKQREALSLAVERGYFETPKAATLDELADEFGVTPQTLSRHLRVAVETLAECAVESMSTGGVAVESE